jgi:hypothetical protein
LVASPTGTHGTLNRCRRSIAKARIGFSFTRQIVKSRRMFMSSAMYVARSFGSIPSNWLEVAALARLNSYGLSGLSWNGKNFS